jgi:hypothetical protein
MNSNLPRSASGYKVKVEDGNLVMHGMLKKTRVFPVEGTTVTVIDTRHFSLGKLVATGVLGGGKAGHVELCFTAPDGTQHSLTYGISGSPKMDCDKAVAWAARHAALQAVSTSLVSASSTTSTD